MYMTSTHSPSAGDAVPAQDGHVAAGTGMEHVRRSRPSAALPTLVPCSVCV